VCVGGCGWAGVCGSLGGRKGGFGDGPGVLVLVYKLRWILLHDRQRR
jgi:hypothetical protein